MSEFDQITNEETLLLHSSTSIGPILRGLAKPEQIVPLGATVSDIFNMAALAAAGAATDGRRGKGTPKAVVILRPPLGGRGISPPHRLVLGATLAAQRCFAPRAGRSA